MKIGIDAKWMFSKPISGRIFIQNVLTELVSLHPGIEWHVFLDQKDKDKQFSLGRNDVTFHYVWSGFNMLSNLFVVPHHAKRLKLDAVFFQTFSPRSSSFKSIVFIHDILQIPYPEYFTWKERLYFKPQKWTLPAADRIITTTAYVKGELKKFRYSRTHQPVDLAPCGVTTVYRPIRLHSNEELSQVRLKFSLPDSYLLFVGRINARKNIENLI